MLGGALSVFSGGELAAAATGSPILGAINAASKANEIAKALWAFNAAAWGSVFAELQIAIGNGNPKGGC